MAMTLLRYFVYAEIVILLVLAISICLTSKKESKYLLHEERYGVSLSCEDFLFNTILCKCYFPSSASFLETVIIVVFRKLLQ